ncbi:hypothetical protein [Pantoea sp. 18069]|uniref:hypothetical protein n=1 Tax=Pantoea sp. 18069 TaxID=2681415 RepID=UPI00135B33CE|nr:hypothetical protein [Pantoea sp. 18069]
MPQKPSPDNSAVIEIAGAPIDFSFPADEEEDLDLFEMESDMNAAFAHQHDDHQDNATSISKAALLYAFINMHIPQLDSIDESPGLVETSVSPPPKDRTAPMIWAMNQSVRVGDASLREIEHLPLSRTDTISWSLLVNGANNVDYDCDDWLFQSSCDTAPARVASNIAGAPCYLIGDLVDTDSDDSDSDFDSEMVCLPNVFID